MKEFNIQVSVITNCYGIEDLKIKKMLLKK